MENADIKSIHAASSENWLNLHSYNNYTGTDKNQSALDVQGVVA